MSVVIRPYDATDLDALLDVWEAASRLAHPFMTDDFLAQGRRDIPSIYIPNAETWVAERAGALVGFIALLPDNEVGAIFVQPGLHGHGIGRALMDKAHGLRGTLEAEVFAANTIGRRFYDAYGFVEVDRRLHDETGQELLRVRFER